MAGAGGELTLTQFTAQQDAWLKGQLDTLNKRAASATAAEQATIDAEKDRIQGSIDAGNERQAGSTAVTAALASGDTFSAMRARTLAEGQARLSESAPEDRDKVRDENKAKSDLTERDITVIKNRLDIHEADFLKSAGDQSDLGGGS